MVAFHSLKFFIDKQVSSLYLKVFPPIYEYTLEATDIAPVLVLDKSNNGYLIGVSNNDIWSLEVSLFDIQTIEARRDISSRLNQWSDNYVQDAVIDFEYFDVSGEKLFNQIVGQTIKDVQIFTDSNNIVFGVKFIFEFDHLICLPGNDGTVLETKHLNKGYSDIFLSRLRDYSVG